MPDFYVPEGESPVSSGGPEELGPEGRWALLERVAASRPLKRSARLREFLVYVGTQSIQHGIESIHEQEIGTTVFGRPATYDTSVDNIVRVNASELRKRLELYFAEEGASEEFIIEIPRGGYLPVFHRREVLPPTLPQVESNGNDAALASDTVESPMEIVHQAAEPLHPVAAARFPGRHFLAAIAALAFVLAIACVYLLWQNRELQTQLQPWKSSPALASFWSEFFASRNEVDIVLADTSLALAKDIAGQSVSLDDYLNYRYKTVPQSTALSTDRLADLELVLDRNNGSVGDFRVAQGILALNPHSATLKLKSAREFTAESIRQNSVILIGSRESNPWVDLYKDQLNFSVEYDQATHHSFVTNRQPAAGEKSMYEMPSDTARSVGYSVVAFLPDISGNGSALVLAGTDSQATRAAGEFVTSDTALRSLREKFSTGRFPYFEVLLESTQLVGTPMRSEMIAFRTHPGVKAKR